MSVCGWHCSQNSWSKFKRDGEGASAIAEGASFLENIMKHVDLEVTGIWKILKLN